MMLKGLGDTLVDTMTAAIIKMEGYNPNFAPNNNPGNLIFANQTGAVKGAGGFAKFPTYDDGVAALKWQIQNYIDRGYSLTSFFNKYAPPNTKNDAGGVQTSAMTQAYINSVSQATGIDPSIPLNTIQAGYSGPDSVTAVASSDSTDAPASDSIASLLDLLPGSDQTTIDSTTDIAGPAIQFSTSG